MTTVDSEWVAWKCTTYYGNWCFAVIKNKQGCLLLENLSETSNNLMDSFADLCRLCRTHNDRAEHWPHLFHCEAAEPAYHLLQKIHSCTNIQITEDDRLPKRICCQCQLALDQAYTFRLQCDEVNTQWLLEAEVLEQSESPVIKVDLDTALPSVASVYVKPELEDDDFDDSEHLSLAELLKVESKEESDGELVKDEPSGDELDDSDEPEEVKPVRRKRGPKSSEPKQKTRFHCSLCPRHFARKCRLREHELRHSGVKNFECETCHNKFFAETDLRTHIARQHATDLPFICEKCGQGFSSKGQRTNHYNTHLESREFACDVCSKSFKTKYILKAHMEFHLPKELRKECYKYKKPVANNKTYVCPYCGKVSTSSGVHNKHIRIHTGTSGRGAPRKPLIILQTFQAISGTSATSATRSLRHPFRSSLICERTRTSGRTDASTARRLSGCETIWKIMSGLRTRTNGPTSANTARGRL